MSALPDGLLISPSAEPFNRDGDGLTLRDYFAAKAMAALITEPAPSGSALLVQATGPGGEVEIESFAVAAYLMADAMIAIRGEP